MMFLFTEKKTAYEYRDSRLPYRAQAFLHTGREGQFGIKLVIREKDGRTARVQVDSHGSLPFYRMKLCQQLPELAGASQEVDALLSRLMRLLLLLETLDRTRADNPPYLHAVCELLHIPYERDNPKQAEERCVEQLLGELKKYGEAAGLVG